MNAMLDEKDIPAEPIKAERCAHCHDRRLVWNEMLGKSIPCPHCRRQPRHDSSGLKAITAVEKRKMNRLIQRAVALEIARAQGSRVAEPGNPYAFDADHASTNRIMERWAVGHGSGLPRTDEELDELAKAAQEHDDTFASKPSLPPPLDDATQTVIDEIVGPNPTKRFGPKRLPPEHRPIHAAPQPISMFVWQWYCSDVPCVRMAEQRGLHHSRIYEEWRATLRYLKHRFATSGHPDLVALLLANPIG